MKAIPGAGSRPTSNNVNQSSCDILVFHKNPRDVSLCRVQNLASDANTNTTLKCCQNQISACLGVKLISNLNVRTVTNLSIEWGGVLPSPKLILNQA